MQTNIVKLTSTAPYRGIFPCLRQVEGYWHGLRSENVLPRRQDIDPRGLASALEFTFVLERVAPGVCRFRIAGRHLGDLMGLDVSGMPISAMFETASRTTICGIVEKICTEPCLTEVELCAGRSLGRGALQGRMFLAPILDDAGEVTRILGCLQTTGHIGRQPRRFKVTDVQTEQIDTDYSIKETFACPAPEFSEAPKQFVQTAAHNLVAQSAIPEATANCHKRQATSGLQLVVDNS